MRLATGADDDLRLLTWALGDLNVGGLQTFLSGLNVKRNPRTLIQRLVAVALNAAVVNKHILAALALDEAEALVGVEPLHCTLFFHSSSYFLAMRIQPH